MIDIGQIMKDGSLYAGHHPVYAKRFLLCKDRDEPEEMTWDNAMSIDGPFKLPTLKELAVLFAYRDALGFDRSVYWSSSKVGSSSEAWVQHFTYSSQNFTSKSNPNRVRLIRTVTQEELEALVC